MGSTKSWARRNLSSKSSTWGAWFIADFFRQQGGGKKKLPQRTHPGSPVGDIGHCLPPVHRSWAITPDSQKEANIIYVRYDHAVYIINIYVKIYIQSRYIRLVNHYIMCHIYTLICISQLSQQGVRRPASFLVHLSLISVTVLGHKCA